jgi:hypothetical protein
MLGDGRKGPRLGERADVQLVDHELACGNRLEAVATTRQRARVEQARWTAQSLRLPARAGIRELLALHHVAVVLPAAGGHEGFMDAVVGVAQLELAP